MPVPEQRSPPSKKAKRPASSSVVGALACYVKPIGTPRKRVSPVEEDSTRELSIDRKRHEDTLGPAAPAGVTLFLVSVRHPALAHGFYDGRDVTPRILPGPRRSGARTGRPDGSTQWNRIGSSDLCSMMFGLIKRDHVSGRRFMTA